MSAFQLELTVEVKDIVKIFAFYILLFGFT